MINYFTYTGKYGCKAEFDTLVGAGDFNAPTGNTILFFEASGTFVNSGATTYSLYIDSSAIFLQSGAIFTGIADYDFSSATGNFAGAGVLTLNTGNNSFSVTGLSTYCSADNISATGFAYYFPSYCFCPNGCDTTYIFNMASGLWEDLNEPSGRPPIYLSGWFTSQYNLGKLNTYIDTCFSGLSGVICPPLGQEEQAIYTEMYKSIFYDWMATSFGGAGNWSNFVFNLKEYDSQIQRSNPNEVAKQYRAAAKDARELVSRLANEYKKNVAQPNMVTFANGRY
jgi:hypothetical protein